MKSGWMKRVLAITLCLAMLTGSVSVNAEGTVSGPSVTADSASESNTTNTTNTSAISATGTGFDQQNQSGTGANQEQTVIIPETQTPTSPTSSTDGVGAANNANKTTSGNNASSISTPVPTVSQNASEQTVSNNTVVPSVSNNTVSNNSISDNSLSDNSLSDNTLSGNEIETISWSQTVDGVTITVTANKDDVEEGTELSVSQLDPVEIEVLENTLEEEEEVQNIVIKKYKAFDITLVNNDKIVQPTGEVKVTFEGDVLIEDKEAGEELKIYHLDDKSTEIKKDDQTGEKKEVAQLNDMSGSVQGDAVVMETPHFSTYLIAISAQADNTITIKHYRGGSTDNEKKLEQIFAPDSIPVTSITANIKIPPKEGDDFKLYKIVIKEDTDVKKTIYKIDELSTQTDNVVKIPEEIKIKNNVVFELYYKEIVNKDFRSNVTLFDYNIKTNLINDNYDTFETKPVSRYLAMNGYDEDTKTVLMKGGVDANKGQGNIVTGLVTGLEAPTYEKLIMGVTDGGEQIVEPGYFSKDPVKGKTIYSDNYSLKFSKLGNTYDLKSVYFGDLNVGDAYDDDEGKVVNKYFFPLTNKFTDEGSAVYIVPSYENNGYYRYVNKWANGKWVVDDNGYRHWESWKNGRYGYYEYTDNYNRFFGMRYDFNFKLGDYIGPLNYIFSGDDDVWVFVDGKLVLDMGGIHNIRDGEVDLWDKLFNIDRQNTEWWTALTDEDKNAVHQVTVLFMDRNESESHCSMKFNLPNVTTVAPIITDKVVADVVFKKVDSLNDNGTLAGAQFKLTGNGIETTSESFSNGVVKFDKIPVGTYTMTEINPPMGYTKSTEQWTVRVDGDKNGGKDGFIIYHQNGTEVSKGIDNKYHITNVSKIKYDVTTAKKAELINWDQRTYKLTLNTGIVAYDENNIKMEVPSWYSETVTVRDYIDERFEVVTDENNLASGGKVEVDANGHYYVTWENVKLNGSSADSLNWQKEITIRAKESYLGGNDVPTNVPANSGVTLKSNDTLVKFGEASPTVNVKIAFNVVDTITRTLFLGESLNITKDEIEERIKKSFESIVDSTLDPDSVYPYYGSNSSSNTDDINTYEETNILFEWYNTDPDDTNAEVINDFNTQNPKEDTDYYIRVRVKPISNGEQSKGVCNNNFIPFETGVYKDVLFHVTVISGQIKITKVIPTGSRIESQGDPIFTFKVTETGSGKTFYRTVRFNSTSESISTAISNLPKGSYVVEELKTMGFEVDGVSVNTGDEVEKEKYCTSKVTNYTVTFAIGDSNGLNSPSVYRQFGDVIFTNKKTRANGKLTYTDVVKNTFEIKERGKTSGYEDSENVDNGRID